MFTWKNAVLICFFNSHILIQLDSIFLFKNRDILIDLISSSIYPIFCLGAFPI